MIDLNAVQKVVDKRLVVDIDELSVEAGEIVGVVGPAGSGTDELLRLLLGQTPATKGSVRIAGIDPREDRDALAHSIGVLFAEDALYEYQTPRRNLIFQCRLHNVPHRRAGEVLAAIGLADHGDVRLDALSSGMRRRLSLGRALLHDPAALILVNPFDRCDAPSIDLVGDLLRDLAERDKAILILADDRSHLGGLCDPIHLLDAGTISETIHPSADRGSQLPFKIPVRLEGRVALINPSEILYVLAEQSRAYLQTTEGRLPSQFTVTELEERLGRSGFFRAHRAYLVNLQHVKEVIPYTRNSFSLILDDAEGTEIPLSKTAARDLRELLGY